MQGLAGDIAGFVAGQVNDAGTDVLATTESSHRNPAEECFSLPLVERAAFAERLAGGLAQAGARRSEPVVVFMHNSLDQLVTWRELGFNFSARREDYARFASLPLWARRTLARHSRDRRPVVYPLACLDAARTHDRLWNAAQRQLVREGRLHNYLRMLWGKKIIEWSESPERALAVMIELNDRYAVDGRDPESRDERDG